MKTSRNILWEIGKGALNALGAYLLFVLGRWLVAHTPAIRDWPAAQLLLTANGLNVALGVLCLVFLGLWLGTRGSLNRLRLRIENNTLSLADMAGGDKKFRELVEKKLDKLPGGF